MIPSSACLLRLADPFPAQPESTAITKPSYTTPKDAIAKSRQSSLNTFHVTNRMGTSIRSQISLPYHHLIPQVQANLRIQPRVMSRCEQDTKTIPATSEFEDMVLGWRNNRWSVSSIRYKL